jgi:Domain of unknown function (DUF4321)
VAAQRGLGLTLVVVVAGVVVGSLLGELMGRALPAGRVQDFLVGGPMIGLNPPATLDLRLMSLTLGLAFKVNVVGVLGRVVSALTLRRL